MSLRVMLKNCQCSSQAKVSTIKAKTVGPEAMAMKCGLEAPQGLASRTTSLIFLPCFSSCCCSRLGHIVSVAVFAGLFLSRILACTPHIFCVLP